METILLVEDEQPIRQMLGFALSRAGYRTLEAGDARQAQISLRETHPDLILMDWMLPDATGIELIRHIKQDGFNSDIPVIMLTAKSSEDDKITGLNSGADDYVSKPFSPKELIARIQAVLRRNTSRQAEDEVLTAQNLRLDKGSHRVTIDGNSLELGPTEFRLLNLPMLRNVPLMCTSCDYENHWPLGSMTNLSKPSVELATASHLMSKHAL